MYEEIKTACLYVRYSSANQTEQSIEGQTRVCKDFCKRHNIKIVEIYADRATSASKDIEKRVNFLKMIKDSEKGNFDAVIVYKLDRFSRSRYDSANYKYRLKRNGVQLISATENISDDPEGIILESVLEGMAEFYSAELSQKINRGLRESAYKHNSIGGSIPLGYKTVDKKLVIDEDSAPIVREAFNMFAEGHTIAEICRLFNAKGYKSSKGTKFGKSSFTKIFRNEKYIGVYKFHEYRAEDAVPAIIDMDLWNRVQKRLAASYKTPPGTFKAKHIYLLSGKLFCGHCGCKMNGNSNGSNGYAYYECYGKKNLHKDCRKKNLKKDFIENIVAQDALSLLTDERIEEIATIALNANRVDVESTTDLVALKGRLHETQVSLNNLLKAIESGLAPDTLVKRMAELEKEKKVIEEEMRKEESSVVFLDKEQIIYWLEQFKEGSLEDDDFKRTLIDLFVNSVTVWDDDPDGFYKISIAYNLTSLKTKTYRLNKDGRSESDIELTAPHREDQTDLPERYSDSLFPSSLHEEQIPLTYRSW
ncbi:MAG: recombinase family protein [Firmicutes bacterium]|nr:recombinase family protein [Bacillota bacterium]